MTARRDQFPPRRFPFGSRMQTSPPGLALVWRARDTSTLCHSATCRVPPFGEAAIDRAGFAGEETTGHIAGIKPATCRGALPTKGKQIPGDAYPRPDIGVNLTISAPSPLANPERVAPQSPGLRVASYPGYHPFQVSSTPRGLRPPATRDAPTTGRNPVGVGIHYSHITQGSPQAGNPGLWSATRSALGGGFGSWTHHIRRTSPRWLETPHDAENSGGL